MQQPDGLSVDRGEAMTPTFSVLIAAYNAEATIAETLDSLLAQTRPDWEAIVVDDGSTDRTLEITSRYASQDPRIRVTSKPNGGASSARNLAARLATADLLCLLDADDLYLPEYFERTGLFIEEHPAFDIYSSNGYFFSADRGPWPDEFPGNDAIRSYSADDMLARNRFSVQSTFRRSVFETVGGFDEGPKMQNEDYYFWIRALLRGAGHIHNPERLWMYRRSATQKTGDPLAQVDGDIWVMHALLDRGEVDHRQARLVEANLRRLARDRAFWVAVRERKEFERRLRGGDLRHARTRYLALHRAYVSKAKYLAGLGIMLLSPRVFSRLLPRLAPRASSQDVQAGTK
jgi:glycosyltransferase involved in cell wall biosynthesis